MAKYELALGLGNSGIDSVAKGFAEISSKVGMVSSIPQGSSKGGESGTKEVSMG